MLFPDKPWNDVACAHAQGVHWVLEYYYRGVASWTWFYPHHYAPMISDLTALDAFDVAFEPGAPFLPFQQLLSVLPAASCQHLPPPYRVRPWLSSCTLACDVLATSRKLGLTVLGSARAGGLCLCMVPEGCLLPHRRLFRVPSPAKTGGVNRRACCICGCSALCHAPSQTWDDKSCSGLSVVISKERTPPAAGT
jgi:hypothetical protein